MDDKQKQILLKVARDTIVSAVKRKTAPAAESDDPELHEQCGCFVTIKNQGRLRGCLGQFTSDKPLIELIAQMAVSSATQDPRFFANPVTSAELEELDIAWAAEAG